jgi:predicted nucleic acid-binding protein
LHVLEVGNAFRLGVFRGLFSPADATAAWTNLELDLRSRRLTKSKVNWDRAFRISARLSKDHSAATGTRSLDVLHVAIAKTLRVREVVSFDLRQRALATAIGLAVAP